jgi:hypothetical protein
MTKTPKTENLPNEERVRAIAYKLWEEEGCPEGQADAHWYRAMEIAVAELNDPDWLKRAEQVPSAASDQVEKLHTRRKVA